jgi:tRNA(Ile)-lysidine synthase
LEKFNPEIKKILKETARNTRVDYDFIAGIGEKKFKKYLHNGSGVGVDLKFLDEDTAIQRLIIREAIRAVKGNLEAVTYRHWEGLQKLLRKRTGWALDLPGGVRVRRGADALIFAKAGQESPAYPLEAFYSLKCPGVTRIPEIGVEAKADFIKSPPDFRRKRSRKEEYFDFGKLKRPVYLRFRKTGDVIRPMGMSGRKALKDLFVDEKVAPEARAKTPLLVSGDKIIWACGVKRSDEAKVSGATKKILRVRIRELKQLT